MQFLIRWIRGGHSCNALEEISTSGFRFDLHFLSKYILLDSSTRKSNCQCLAFNEGSLITIRLVALRPYKLSCTHSCQLSVCLYPPFLSTRPSDRNQILHTYSDRYGTHSHLNKLAPRMARKAGLNGNNLRNWNLAADEAETT